MRRDGSLRAAGRTRGVEDGHVVIWIDVDVGHRGAVDEQVVEAQRTVGYRAPAPYDDDPRVDRPLRRCGHPLHAVVVGEHDGRTGVPEGEHHLVGLPPRVHRHRDRPDRRDRGERGDPLGRVPHRDRDPVTFADSEFGDEGVADPPGEFEHPGHRPAFVLEDDEVVGPIRRQREQCPDVRWRSGEHLGRDTEDVGLFDLEHRAGRTHCVACLVERHRHGRRLYHLGGGISDSRSVGRWVSPPARPTTVRSRRSRTGAGRPRGSG